MAELTYMMNNSKAVAKRPSIYVTLFQSVAELFASRKSA